MLDLIVAAVKIAEGATPEFDLPDPNVKYRTNRFSKAIRLYLNVYLSLIERLLLIQKNNRELVRKVGQSGDQQRADWLERLLFPDDDNRPSGHRYGLGQESAPNIPNEEVIFSS